MNNYYLLPYAFLKKALESAEKVKKKPEKYTAKKTPRTEETLFFWAHLPKAIELIENHTSAEELFNSFNKILDTQNNYNQNIFSRIRSKSSTDDYITRAENILLDERFKQISKEYPYINRIPISQLSNGLSSFYNVKKKFKQIPEIDEKHNINFTKENTVILVHRSFLPPDEEIGNSERAGEYVQLKVDNFFDFLREHKYNGLNALNQKTYKKFILSALKKYKNLIGILTTPKQKRRIEYLMNIRDLLFNNTIHTRFPRNKRVNNDEFLEIISNIDTTDNEI